MTKVSLGKEASAACFLHRKKKLLWIPSTLRQEEPVREGKTPKGQWLSRALSGRTTHLLLWDKHRVDSCPLSGGEVIPSKPPAFSLFSSGICSWHKTAWARDGDSQAERDSLDFSREPAFSYTLARQNQGVGMCIWEMNYFLALRGVMALWTTRMTLNVLTGLQHLLAFSSFLPSCRLRKNKLFPFHSLTPAP